MYYIHLMVTHHQRCSNLIFIHLKKFRKYIATNAGIIIF